MNLVMLPMWILSGTFFSYSDSRCHDPIGEALPLTALNDALRAVMIDGAAVTTLGTPWRSSWRGWGELRDRTEDFPLALTLRPE